MSDVATLAGTRELRGPLLRPALASAVALSAVLVALWVFPVVWYTRTDPHQKQLWLAEQASLAGWEYQSVGVDASAERLLAADRTVSGEFREQSGSRQVRVFSAKRYEEKPHDIGLFVHTPDRCWTEAGWKFEPIVPDHVELVLHGVPIVFERRLFVTEGQRELVYFGGLVGGQALPYRLDHNLSVGMRHALKQAAEHTTGMLRASDQRFWARVWDSFVSRRPLLGPKQFIRVSTSCGQDVAASDAVLVALLNEWLQPGDFEKEHARWLAGH